MRPVLIDAEIQDNLSRVLVALATLQ